MIAVPDSRLIIPQKGLVGWWDISIQKCYPDTGSTLTNLISGPNLTVAGAPTYNAGKPYGRKSVDLNSSTKYLSAVSGITSLQPTGALSFALWLKPNSYNAAYNAIGGLTLAGQARGYLFDTNTSSGNIFFYIGNGTWGTASVARGSTGVWTHYVGTWDGTTIRIYKDGVVSGTTGSKSSITYTSTGLNIGRYYTSSGNTYDGRVALPLIYNRALSADEVTYLYNITKQQFA